MRKLLIKGLFPTIMLVVLAAACGGEKFPLPQPTESSDGISAVGDTVYLQLSPVWGNSNGYDFDTPTDILVGREPLLYVADTGNDRVVMLDLAGNVLGQSQPIAGPVALTQDAKLRLLVVTDRNEIYRIDLVAVTHDIASAPAELVFDEVDNPDRKYTGIAAFVRTDTQGQVVFGYYVTATGNDARDNQVLIFPEDFDTRVPSAVNLEPLGLGILSAAEPSGITTLRDFSVDFIFCMIGQNSFKVQWITTGEFGFTTRLSPADGSFDLFNPGKFSAPEDVTVDLEGNIFVIDAQRNAMFKFSAQAAEQQSFGEAGSGEKQFNNPKGIAEFNKTLYVADTGNNRIVRFKLSTDVGN